MEIIDGISQLVIAFVGIGGLVLMVMIFAYQLGNVISNIFAE